MTEEAKDTDPPVPFRPAPGLRALIAAVDWLDEADIVAAARQAGDDALIEQPVLIPGLVDYRQLARPLLIGRNTSFLGGMLAGRTAIGRYCTIGRRVDIGASPHVMTELSTGFLSPRFREAFQDGSPDSELATTTIGCDVWIGMSAYVRSGVRIGHGAVLQPGAVVIRDVAPYAVVAGHPARVCGERFPPAIVERLLATSWWTLPPTVVAELPASDISGCLDHVERWRDSERGRG